MTGHLYGVGVGPGDPELITLKAAHLIKNADVIAYHSGTTGRSIARTIADSLISENVIEELLIYPVTTGPTAHPLGYYGAVDDFYDESAERLSKHLDVGRTVVVLAEGDPLFYSSYMYLHDRLSSRFPSEIVPGVTSLTAAATALRIPLARHEDILTVLPGTLPVPELARRIADTDAAVIMKLGRTFAGVREALQQAGRLADALYVERATTGEQRVMPVSQVDASTVPYFSMIVVPGRDRRLDSAGRSAALSSTSNLDHVDPPRLYVVGLGPGLDGWTTPEVAAVLAEVDHVVGYS
ncbi:MAG TPA: precorrin-2 C(20)-methyltransferase, partial [Propionibacteriaceae bacterium]|nr:precorrin-2 C(20)-methyltransferase [Propionibacteriaceae bacterium]